PAQVTQTQIVTVIATSVADPSRSASAPVVHTTLSGAEGPNGAACVSVAAPDAVQPGQQFAATVVMRNAGDRIWRSPSFELNSPHALASQNPNDTDRWGFNRVGLPVQFVLPNQSATFSFTAKAPTTPGTYAFDWRMVQERLEYFGATCSKS